MIIKSIRSQIPKFQTSISVNRLKDYDVHPKSETLCKFYHPGREKKKEMPIHKLTPINLSQQFHSTRGGGGGILAKHVFIHKQKKEGKGTGFLH